MVKALDLAVGDGPVGKQAGKTVVTGIEHCPHSTHVQVGLLLAGKAGIRQVFCRGTGAHRHIGVGAVALAQLLVGFGDGLL
jgi:hypothetical protein